MDRQDRETAAENALPVSLPVSLLSSSLQLSYLLSVRVKDEVSFNTSRKLLKFRFPFTAKRRAAQTEKERRKLMRKRPIACDVQLTVNVNIFEGLPHLLTGHKYPQRVQSQE